MNENTINFNSSISGEYLVEIVKADGSISRPFGDKKRKNLILDTFFNAIMRDNYLAGAQAFIQSCRVGGGTGSDTPAVRTQTGLQGQQVLLTHLSDTFTANASSSPTSSLILQRDFKFDVNNTANPISCREAVVGCFGSSGGGMNAGTLDITVSRFVFPSDIIINTGEQLRISYTLNIRLRYLYENIPVVMSSNGLDLTGIVRYTSTANALNCGGPSATVTYINANGFGAGATSSAHYYTRTYTTSNVNSFGINTTNALAGGTNSIWGLGNITATFAANKIGFFDTAHVNSLTTYPAARPVFSILGSVGSFYLSNYTTTSNSASVDVNYYFPPHSASRTAGGIYIWYQDLGANSVSAVYLKFTESNFTTNRSITIPIGVPIGFKIRYTFSRE